MMLSFARVEGAASIRAKPLAFRAYDWPTAINVGLNDVALEVVATGRVSYSIRYARWAEVDAVAVESR